MNSIEVCSRLGPVRQGTVLMLLTNAYDPDPRVRQEALALRSFGYGVRLLAWDRDGKHNARESVEGIEIERVFVPSKHGRGTMQIVFYALVYVRLFWLALRVRFDIVHCHDLDTLPLGFVLACLRRKPVVYDAHESFSDMLTGNVHAVVLRAIRKVEDFLIRRIDLLITVGEQLRVHFEMRGARHSVVVGNWKRLDEFAIPSDLSVEVRRRFGIPDTGLMILCITHLRPDRKLEELLDAVEACPGTYAVIGGDGPLKRLVEDRAAANPRIVYVGFVRGPEIARYTCAADVIYYGFDPDNPNSRFSAPNKLFEALAAGKPIISGDFGEIADVIRKTECGVVLDEYSPHQIRNALELLKDKKVRQSIGAKAAVCGRLSYNWEAAEGILRREYARLFSGVRARFQTESRLVNGTGARQ